MSPIGRRAFRRATARELTAPRKGQGDQDTARYARNRLNCFRSREKCSCDAGAGRRATSIAQIGNIFLEPRSCPEWDAKADRFTNIAGANMG